MIVLDIETSGLEAQECFITCVGILTEDTGIRQFTHSAKAFRDSPHLAEETIIADFRDWWQGISESGTRLPTGEVLVSYNGEGFDFPFLDARAALHKLPLRGFPPSPEQHIDLSKFAKSALGRFTKKDTAASMLGDLYVPRSTYGGFLARIYKYQTVTDAQHYDMLQHNAIDLVTTAKLYGELLKYPDFNAWVRK